MSETCCPPEHKSEEPPLVHLKVTNPVTYLRKWWSRVVSREGIDFRFHIRPLTAIAIAVVFVSLGFGVGRFVIPPINLPFFKYEVGTGSSSPSPTAEIWKDTAYTGTLKLSDTTGKYFLVTSSAEAITLDVPANIDLKNFLGKRIFASGKYNKSTRVLIVADASSMEVLPKTPVAIPTTLPTPTPVPTTLPTPTPEETVSPLPSATP